MMSTLIGEIFKKWGNSFKDFFTLVHILMKTFYRCNYAHGLDQLKVSFHHGKYKTRNCEAYHETGYCRYGARCSFIHDLEEGILKCSIANKEVSKQNKLFHWSWNYLYSRVNENYMGSISLIGE